MLELSIPCVRRSLSIPFAAEYLRNLPPKPPHRRKRSRRPSVTLVRCSAVSFLPVNVHLEELQSKILILMSTKVKELAATLAPADPGQLHLNWTQFLPKLARIPRLAIYLLVLRIGEIGLSVIFKTRIHAVFREHL